MSRKIFFFVLLLFVSFGNTVDAQESERWDITPTMIEKGSVITFSDLTIAVLPNAFAESTTLRLKDLGPFDDATATSLSAAWRSHRHLVHYRFDAPIQGTVVAQLAFAAFPENRRHRIFWTESLQKPWQRLRTEIDQTALTGRSTLPAQEGYLVMATHRFAQERPIAQEDFQSFTGTRYSDAAAIVDVASGVFLYRDDARKVRAIASLTKLMTAYLFLAEQPILDRTVTYSRAYDRGGARVPLADGDTVRLQDVLMGTLLPSANNMAALLAASTSRDAVQFVAAMNEQAKLLKFGKTTFVEPTGLDAGNVSTAGNCARMARFIFQAFPDVFYDAAVRSSYRIVPTNGDVVEVTSTNKFDGHKKYSVTAFKTGYYPGSAERTLIVQVEDARKHAIIIVLLGNPHYGTIFEEAYQFADWAFTNWEFHNYPP